MARIVRITWEKILVRQSERYGLTGEPGDSAEWVLFMTLTRDGPFQFPIFVADSTPYTVVVTAQPPGQNCTVTNGAGTMHSSVDNIQVNCA